MLVPTRTRWPLGPLHRAVTSGDVPGCVEVNLGPRLPAAASGSVASPPIRKGRSPIPSTGSASIPVPSARITNRLGAQKTMWLPSGAQAGVYAPASVRRFTSEPSGRIT